MSSESPLDFSHDIFARGQLGIITDVKYEIDANGKISNVFSGFVGVQLIQEAVRFDYVRWTNPAFGSFGNNYGIISVPMVNDVVFIMFDIQNRPFIAGMIWYDQAVKGMNDLTIRPDEQADPRLALFPGEVMVRGLKGNSLTLQNDGSMAYRVNDQQPDSSSPVVLIDSQGNFSATNMKAAKLQCQSAEIDCSGNAKLSCVNAEVDCTQAKIVSDDIELGKTGALEPIVRNQDFSTHIDPITGLPVTAFVYQSNSASTKST